ncbi:MAG: metal ABC transporter permease [Thermoanaerobaculia bacterium]|nr:metal ABC transporter permease [Thermoanaerobaculia bacterium]
MRDAILAGLLSSIVCGALGTFVVLRRLTSLAGGLSHAVFGGLGLCHLLGWPPQIGGLATAGLVSLILGPMPREQARSQDALIATLWAAGMAAGFLFIQLAPGYPPNLHAYLFGNILLVSRTDLAWLLVFDVATLGLIAFFYKELVALTFDETFAQVQGVPVRGLSTLLLLLVGAAVVVLLPVVGLLLVLAQLTIPTLVSLQLLRELRAVLFCSIALGIAITLGGLGLAYRFNLPSGPAIILLGTALLGGVYLAKGLARKLRPAQPS